MSARKDLDDAKLSACGADEKDAIFDAAKKKTLESFGGSVPEERDLPTGVRKSSSGGVRKSSSGKFTSNIRWGGKKRHIGSFDTPEQASAAYMSVKKDLDGANISTFSADEVDTAFGAAQQKAVEAVGGIVPKKKKSKGTSERDLPRGVYKKSSGKYPKVVTTTNKLPICDLGGPR